MAFFQSLFGPLLVAGDERVDLGGIGCIIAEGCLDLPGGKPMKGLLEEFLIAIRAFVLSDDLPYLDPRAGNPGS